MPKVTLQDISSGYNSQTIYNENNQTIETGFDNTLSRDGSTPNQMEADLDMNSNDINNVQQLNANQIYLNGTALTIGEVLAGNKQVYTATAIAGQSSITGLPTYSPNTNSIDLFIGGVHQNPDAYNEDSTNSITLTSGDTLDGGEKITVLVSGANELDVANASNVSYTPSGAGAVATNVQDKLRESVSVKDFSNTVAGLQNANNASNGKLYFDGSTVYTIDSALTLNVEIDAPDVQIFNITTGSINFEGKASQNVSSLWFAPDPWDSFKVAAEQLAAGKGGLIHMANAVYRADTPVVISSNHPVHISGEMFASPQESVSPIEPSYYIAPSTGIGATEFLIEYSGFGGGHINGLAFLDDSDLENATFESRRVVSIGGCIKFTTWYLSSLTNCYFKHIKGRAIQTVDCTMSQLKNIWVRACGDTGKPALDIAPTGTTQSFHITDARLEINYLDTYLKLGAGALACKLTNIGFEANNSDANTLQTFLEDGGERTQAVSVHLNRTSATKMVLSGSDLVYTNIVAYTGQATNVVNITGTNVQLLGYLGKNHTFAVDEITCSGSNFTFQGCTNFGGGIRCTGDHAEITANLIAPLGGTNGFIEVSDRSSVKCNIRNATVSKHGVYLAGNTNRVYSSNIEDMLTGSSCIYAVGSQHIINGNNLITGTGVTGIDTSTAGNSNVHGNNIQGAGTAIIGGAGDVVDGTNT